MSDRPTERHGIILVNAVYFNGIWEQEFTGGITKLFHCEDNTTRELEFLHSRSGFYHAVDKELNSQCLRVYFKAKTYAFYILLPVDCLHQLLQRLTLPSLYHVMDNLSYQHMSVSFPKFTLEHSLDLKPALNSLGVQTIFSSVDADLTGIHKGGTLFVNEIKHKVYFNVSEKGVEAAACTFGGLRAAGGLPKRFVANKPFLFFVRDEASGLIVFIGTFSGL